MAKNRTRRLPIVLSLIVTAGAVASAVHYKRQLDQTLWVNHGDSLMVMDKHTGEAVEYVPKSAQN